MKTLDYQEWRNTYNIKLDRLQATLNPYKPRKEVPVIVYNDILHFVTSYSFHVTGNQAMKVRLKPTGQNDDPTFTVDIYETDIETLTFLNN